MVRCADCGFLALFRKETRQLVEADATFRQTCQFTQPWGAKETPFSGPLCVKLIPDFAGTKEAVNRDRGHCPGFRQWVPCFSPRDHTEMELADNEKRFQEERLANDRKFQKELRDEADKRQDARDRAQRRWTGMLAILAAVVSVLAVGVGAFLNHFLAGGQSPPVITLEQKPPVINVQIPEKLSPQKSP